MIEISTTEVIDVKVQNYLESIAIINRAVAIAWFEAGFPLPFFYDAIAFASHFEGNGEIIKMEATIQQALGQSKFDAYLNISRRVPSISLSGDIVTISARLK